MDDNSKPNHLTSKELKMKLTKQETDFGSKLKDTDDVINALKTSIELYQKSNMEYEDKLFAFKSMLQEMQNQLTDLQSEQNSSLITLKKKYSELLKEATIAQHTNTIKQLRENISENQNKQSKRTAAYEKALEEQSSTLADLQSRLELSQNALKQTNINLISYQMEALEKDAQRLHFTVNDLRKTVSADKETIKAQIKENVELTYKNLRNEMVFFSWRNYLPTALIYFAIIPFVGAIGNSYIRLALILILQLIVIRVLSVGNLLRHIKN